MARTSSIPSDARLFSFRSKTSALQCEKPPVARTTSARGPLGKVGGYFDTIGQSIFRTAVEKIEGNKYFSPLNSSKITMTFSAKRGLEKGLPVSLTALLNDKPDSKTLVVAVHGLGDDANAPYLQDLARKGKGQFSVLRMNLRGAALDGGGVYTLEAFEDIAQMLQSPALKRYEKIALVGYSFGGSMMMNYLAHHPDPRVVIGVGVSAALNVTQSTAALDNKKSIAEKFIGGQLLKNMQAVYAASYKDHPGRYTSPPPEQTAKIKSLLEWNRAVVAKNIEQFNIEMSPEATIANIKVPTTLFQAANDPVVSEAATRQAVACGAPDVIHLVQEQSGGHVYMPNITTRVIDAVRVATE